MTWCLLPTVRRVGRQRPPLPVVEDVVGRGKTAPRQRRATKVRRVPSKRYENNWLYCTACDGQPEFFLEITDRQVNEVNRDGSYIGTRDRNLHYRCPQCLGKAGWGGELNSRARNTPDVPKPSENCPNTESAS